MDRLNMKISVIVLHYNDIMTTQNYIDNLLKLNWDDISYQIIIVDNCSPDGSGKSLKELYRQNRNVWVLLLNSNVGFSKGNNEGIKFAKLNFDPNLYIISNNDILIEDHNFMQKLVKCYEKESFAVLGPDVFSIRRKMHQSPMRQNSYNEKELKKMIISTGPKIKILKIIDKIKIYELLSSLKHVFCSYKKNRRNDVAFYKIQHENCVLHGAFFVLSSIYLEAYPFGLYPETFLYLEEDILAFLAKSKGLRTIYTPELVVKHYEGSSSIKKTGNRCRKYIFELQETKKSCMVMIDLLNKYKETGENN